MLGLIEQCLERAGDGTHERPGERGCTNLVELIGERRYQVPGDRLLSIELDLERTATDRRDRRKNMPAV